MFKMVRQILKYAAVAVVTLALVAGVAALMCVAPEIGIPL